MFWEYGLLHLILITTSFYYFGIAKGIIALVLVYYLVKWIGRKFGYEICAGNDVIHMFDSDKVPHNCILVLEMEKGSFEAIQNRLYQTMICNIKRYREVAVNLFGFFFWKEIDKQTSKKQVKRWEEDIHTRDEVIAYCKKQLAIKMPMDKPQWEFIFVEDYSETESVALLKFHHSFSDGGGIMNSLLFMNNADNIPQDMFRGRSIPFYMKILTSLLYPVCLLIAAFELSGCKWDGHNKIQTKDGENCGESTLLISKEYDLNDIKTCYKKFKNVTLNNYMMGIISKSIYQWYKMNGVDSPKDISTIVPVVMKPLSPKINEVSMENWSSGVTFRFALKENLEEAITVNKKGFGFYYQLPHLMHIMTMLRSFAIFPNALSRYLYHMACYNLDMTMSNVSGSKEPMYWWDRKVSHTYGFLANFCRCNLNMTYNSYNYKIFFQIVADKNLQMDPRQLMALIEQNVEEQIKGF